MPERRLWLEACTPEVSAARQTERQSGPANNQVSRHPRRRSLRRNPKGEDLIALDGNEIPERPRSGNGIVAIASG